MGIFDRFNPPADPRGRTYEGQRAEPSEDEQALARYRYMLKTAPPVISTASRKDAASA